MPPAIPDAGSDARITSDSHYTSRLQLVCNSSAQNSYLNVMGYATRLEPLELSPSLVHSGISFSLSSLFLFESPYHNKRTIIAKYL